MFSVLDNESISLLQTRRVQPLLGSMNKEESVRSCHLQCYSVRNINRDKGDEDGDNALFLGFSPIKERK